MEKKYYWLKLKKDFFKRHDIRVIEAMPNGKDYILFYLKLLCESVDHSGNLRFSDRIPYNEEMLATITNTDIDVVRSAIKIFSELDMMDILDDGTLYMTEVEQLLGSETVWAEKKRLWRENKKTPQGQTEDIVLPLSDKSKSKRIDIEIEQYNIYVQEFEEVWALYPKKQGKENSKKAYIKARKSGVEKDTIVQGINKYIEQIKKNKTEPRYIKHGSTWFNQHCWEDDYDDNGGDTSLKRTFDGTDEDAGRGGWRYDNE